MGSHEIRWPQKKNQLKAREFSKASEEAKGVRNV
jgi:hypothetical protein